ncbi:hypothetical protein DITRI_Ditri13aG0050500 [Diplodiscus trichospermus]
MSWDSPKVGKLKFNVDGSAMGKPGPVGIGCILIDHLDEKKMAFSKPIGIVDSNMAELMAIREASILFISSPWSLTHKLIIESDSANAVKWVLNSKDVPWRVRKWATHIENRKAKVKDWSIVHVLREGNCTTDALAKEEVSKATDFVEVVVD